MAPLIRQMRREDLPEVLRNERSGYVYPWSEGLFKECLTRGDECWLSVSDNNNAVDQGTTVQGVASHDFIIGHGVLSVAAGESHLLNVCVHPDWQGNGFGRVIVEHLLKRAKALSASVIFLEVRPSNLMAFQLYDTLGFNEVGIRQNYYPAITGREDAVILAKELLDD